MALPYDLRELIYNGKPLWKRILECIFSLSEQIDELDGNGGSSANVNALITRIEALEEKVEEIENS